jgi:hypothetical protein
MKELTEQDFQNAAKLIGCEVAVIKAVNAKEAPRGAFDKQGRPTILFEPFQFGRLTGHKFDGVTVNINGKDYPLSLKGKWSIGRAQYGKYSIQYDKLEAAEKLDVLNARMACSWGAFQLMGFNHDACGYPLFIHFYAAMYESAGKQLEAFIKYLESKDLVKYLVSKDFTKFAELYNGKGQIEKYAKWIQEAYESFL